MAKWIGPNREYVYTPTTGEVRATFRSGWTLTREDTSAGAYPAFNRWLTDHDRQVAAVAWDMAVASLVYEDGTPVEVLAVTNPYRNRNTQLGGH